MIVSICGLLASCRCCKAKQVPSGFKLGDGSSMLFPSGVVSGNTAAAGVVAGNTAASGVAGGNTVVDGSLTDALFGESIIDGLRLGNSSTITGAAGVGFDACVEVREERVLN